MKTIEINVGALFNDCWIIIFYSVRTKTEQGQKRKRESVTSRCTDRIQNELFELSLCVESRNEKTLRENKRFVTRHRTANKPRNLKWKMNMHLNLLKDDIFDCRLSTRSSFTTLCQPSEVNALTYLRRIDNNRRKVVDVVEKKRKNG